uniref:Reverse transcriptase domain-containing protein n=1 Tax=Octopus bimaculoides TaxID=37653 RepID=A0A0L8FU79_OCTBM
MEKAFDRVPCSLIWCSMRKLGIDEWLIRAVQAMYRDFLQAITQEFKTGCPWELLYADDLALIAESLAKTKVLISRKVDKTQTPSGRWPCPICRKGVGRNSIRCTQCKLWTHKRSSHKFCLILLSLKLNAI